LALNIGLTCIFAPFSLHFVTANTEYYHFFTKIVLMGQFKRILGEGDKKSDQQLEKEIDKIKAGEITKIYPILKPSDWLGIEAGALKQTLIGNQEEPLLVLGFGYDTPNNFVFLMPKDLEGKDPQKLLADAYDNLEQVPSNFEVVEQLGGKILMASGHDFSSEKILCESHMREAHKLLEAEELFVSIPRRRCMMIIDKQADDELLKLFIALHEQTWEDDSYGNAPILDALFVVKENTITAVLPLVDKNT